MEAILAYTSMITFPAGQYIQVEGDECCRVGFILKGALRVYRSRPNGREQVMRTMGPGMHFNAIPVIQNKQILLASIQALTPVSLLFISRIDYLSLLQTRAEFGFAMLKDLSLRLEHMTDLVEDLSLRSVRGRLARFLLAQANGTVVSGRWTQDEIAAQLGTVRDVVGRSLRDFMDAGLIRREGPRLLLLSRSKLEEEANS